MLRRVAALALVLALPLSWGAARVVLFVCGDGQIHLKTCCPEDDERPDLAFEGDATACCDLHRLEASHAPGQLDPRADPAPIAGLPIAAPAPGEPLPIVVARTHAQQGPAPPTGPPIYLRHASLLN